MNKFIVFTVMIAMLSASCFASEEPAKTCKQQINEARADYVIGNLGAYLGAGGGSMVLTGILGATNPVILAAGGAVFAGGATHTFIRDAKMKRMLRLIDQAYDHDGATLRRVYKKYQSVTEKLNEEATKTNGLPVKELLSFDEFAKEIILANENGTLCSETDLAQTKKEIAETIYYSL